MKKNEFGILHFLIIFSFHLFMKLVHPVYLNPSKVWGENFFALYSIVWVLGFGGVVVTEVYKQWSDLEYMLLGLGMALPYVIYPLLFPGAVDRSLPLSERYWVKVGFF